MLHAPWMLLTCCLAGAVAKAEEQLPLSEIPAPAAPATPAPLAPSLEPSLLSDTRAAPSGARLRVLVFTSDSAAAHTAIEAAIAELARAEAALSERMSGSQLSFLNGAAGKGPVKLSSEALSVLGRIKDLASSTHGAFALTAGALDASWDFSSGPRAGRVPEAAQLRERLPLVDDSRLLLHPTEETAELGANMSVKLGSLAKAYALSRAVLALRQQGITDALVALDGDIACLGKKGPRPWLVGVQDPRASGYFGILPLADEAIVTVSDYEHYFVAGDVRYHSVLDPKSGMPAKGSRSVSVIGADPLTAKLLATAIMVLGASAGLQLLDTLSGYAAVIVEADNNVVVSKTVSDRFRILRAPTNQ
jgi:FAD:protein FMN transferase